MKKYLIPGIIALFLIGWFSYIGAVSTTNTVLLDSNRHPAKDGANCDITTRTAKAVGDDLTTEVLATSTNRAWARISVPRNATNTSFAEFNDIDATTNSAFALGAASTTPSSLEFGLTTSFPYIGAVNVINSPASSTVLVVECVYS